MIKKSFVSMFFILVITAACSSPALPANNQVVTEANSQNKPQSSLKLNLNTVTGDELVATIPGFSSRMIREFQEYRPYVSIQQFRREIGKYVGDAQVAEYEKYVYVPISINNSDVDTLMQLPGLDSTEAESLISGRPYSSANDFLTKLSEYVSPDELEIGKSYLGEN